MLSDVDNRHMGHRASVWRNTQAEGTWRAGSGQAMTVLLSFIYILLKKKRHLIKHFYFNTFKALASDLCLWFIKTSEEELLCRPLRIDLFYTRSMKYWNLSSPEPSTGHRIPESKALVSATGFNSVYCNISQNVLSCCYLLPL